MVLAPVAVAKNSKNAACEAGIKNTEAKLLELNHAQSKKMMRTFLCHGKF